MGDLFPTDADLQLSYSGLSCFIAVRTGNKGKLKMFAAVSEVARWQLILESEIKQELDPNEAMKGFINDLKGALDERILTNR